MKLQKIPPLVAFLSLLKFLVLGIAGRVRLPRGRLGRDVLTDDGKRFTVFRNLWCHAMGKSPAAPAVFVVRFKFARFSSSANRRISWLPLFLFVGFKGLREKVWAEEAETGCWQGMYEFASEEAAHRYQESFVLGTMCKRAIPESLSKTVIPGATLDEYLRDRLA